MDISIVFQIIINSLLLGGLYMIVSIGLNLIYGVMRIVNYAQGEFLMIGMYLSYFLYTTVGLNPYVSIPIIFFLLFAFGSVLHKYIIEPLFKLPYESQIISFVGIIYVLQNLALLLWSPSYRSVKFDFATQSLILPYAMVPMGKLIVLLISLSTATLLYVMLKRTTLGLYIRATSQDSTAALMLGIDVRKIRILTFALGIATMGVGAGVMLPLYFVHPFMGNYYTILALVIITLGGLGNFQGTVLGSFIVGFIETIVGVFINPEFALAIAFLMFIVILLIRPSGIMGE